MGLINLQTNLKSLTYGGNKPYVTKDINRPPSSNQFAMEVTRRVDDISRITQMLVDKPGIKYLINNEKLTAPKLMYKIADQKHKVNPSSPTSLLQISKGALIDTVSTIGSTLAQVATNGTGTHFVKGFGKGITPYLINTNLINSAYTNGNISISSDQASALVDNIPNTEILQVSRITSLNKTYLDEYNDIDTYTTSARLTTTSENKTIRKEDRVGLGNQGVGRETSYYKKQAVSKNQYWFASDDNPMMASETDKINALPAHIGKYKTGDGTDVEQTLKAGQTIGRDFVKFRFHVLTPETERVLYFRAFLTNFSDSYNGSSNDVKYLGRGETFYTYAGFQRKISLSFKVAASTRAELMPIYQKLNFLAGSTAPTYSDNKQFMRGTFSKLTIGDYVTDLTGILNSVTYTWNSEYPWEIALSEPENKNGDALMKELPMVLECNIEFTPIHSFTPTADAHDYISVNIDESMRKAFFNTDFLDSTKGLASYGDTPPVDNTRK